MKLEPRSAPILLRAFFKGREVRNRRCKQKRTKTENEFSVCSRGDQIWRTMDRWAGKIALVTGASSGIGAAISGVLLEHGLTVIGCGRNLDNLQVNMRFMKTVRRTKTQTLVGWGKTSLFSVHYAGGCIRNGRTRQVHHLSVWRVKRGSGRWNV